MEDLGKLKAMWMELNQRVTALEAENRILARKVMNEKYVSAKDKLIKKYNAFIILEIITGIYMCGFILFNPLTVERYRIVTAVYWFLFFLCEVCIDWYLREGVINIDVYHSTVREISIRAARNWKIHKFAIIIGFPLALGACVLFALSLNANLFTIYGMLLGGLVGAGIGISQLKAFMNYYRLLQSSDE